MLLYRLFPNRRLKIDINTMYPMFELYEVKNIAAQKIRFNRHDKT